MRSLFLVIGIVLCFSTNAAAVDAALHAFDYKTILQEPDRNNYCAITFDDGPTAFTSELLDALQEEGVKATFFVLGKQVVVRPDMVQRMVAEGHEVAMHGYSHPNMRRMGTRGRARELDETLAVLENIGVTPRYFRPPYGNYDAALVSMAQKRGLSVVLWTTDSRDWKGHWVDYYNMPTCLGTAITPERMRGVFLFHDTRHRTAEEVHRMVSSLRDIGCQKFVTVHEYFTRRTEPLPDEDAADRLVAQHGQSLSDRGVELPAPSSLVPDVEGDKMLGSKQRPAFKDVSLPAGRAPIPMARSSHPWLRHMFFRGE